MSVLDNYNTWKEFLANRLQQAQQQGMSQETISNVAYEIGDYLASSVEVKNDETKVLRELWNAASPEEQQALANTMVKLVQNESNMQ
ncbi:MAG TPA: DUF3243 domain-containing protein [Bacillota bacterium]|nr:DUF3243 domain-containing protein [Bacillota bacterium]